MQIRPRQDSLEAIRFDMLDTEQQEKLAAWCNGRLRGMRLDPRDRIIQFDVRDGEVEAGFGDWILREAPGMFRVLSDPEINLLYEPLTMPDEGTPTP